MNLTTVLKRLNRKLPKPNWAEYEKMAEYPYINSALFLYTEEMLQVDPDTQKFFAVEVKNKKAKSFLDEVSLVSDFENLLQIITYNTCKYGEFGVKLKSEPPYFELYSPKFYEVNEEDNIVHIKNEEDIPLDKFQVFAFYTDYEDYPRGTSILKPARKVFQRLKLLEDSLIIYRLTRAPARNVFYIPVGDMSPQEAQRYVEELAKKHKQKSIIDPRTGMLKTEPNPMSIDEDYWIPEFENGKSARVEQLAGASNVSDIADIEYMLSQLFGALRIPKAYMGNEYDVNRATLVMQDIKFARTIKRYQGFIKRGLEKLFYKALKLKGFNEVPEVKMYFPNVDDMQRMDYLLQKADLIDRLSQINLPSGNPMFTDEELKQMWEGEK